VSEPLIDELAYEAQNNNKYFRLKSWAEEALQDNLIERLDEKELALMLIKYSMLARNSFVQSPRHNATHNYTKEQLAEFADGVLLSTLFTKWQNTAVSKLDNFELDDMGNIPFHLDLLKVPLLADLFGPWIQRVIANLSEPDPKKHFVPKTLTMLPRCFNKKNALDTVVKG
jgi:hypothetical protein